MTASQVDPDSYRRLPRRRFTHEFKQEVVERLLHTGVTVAQLAREHALHPNQLCRWRNEFLRQKHPHDKARSAERELKAIELLPIEVAAEVKASQTRCAPDTGGAGRVGMRVVFDKGEIQISDGCSARLLRALVEALA